MSASQAHPRIPADLDITSGSPIEVKLAFLEARTRRHFLRSLGGGLGTLFVGTLASKLAPSARAAGAESEALDFSRDPRTPLSPLPPQFPAKVRRVIYLHMAGAPSQLELFEHKPELKKFDGEDCPASFLAGKRFAFISGVPKLLGSQYPFHQAGQSGQWISDRLPHIEKQVNDICFIKSMRTDQFNHAPAQLLVQTGNPRLGYASFGSWVVYGLGTENQNLPGFIVLLSGGKTPDGGKQLWSSGFLPSVYQGVQCRSHGEPVLYLDNPAGVSRSLRRSMLDTIDEINQQTYAAFGNPETVTRIAQYEMAFRMQFEAREAFDLGRESSATRSLYGDGEFASACLIARRLAERGVRIIQIYYGNDQPWDDHQDIHRHRDHAQKSDRPIAAQSSTSLAPAAAE